MEKVLLCVGISMLAGCMSTGTQTQKLQTSDTRSCAQNFTYDGGFFAGRTFKTHDFIKGVSKSTAMQRAIRYTVNDGWTITNSDKEMGIISATQTVSYGDGKTVPLNISIESASHGVNVNMTYATSGGVTSPVDAVKNHFCSTIEAIAKK